MFRTPAAKNDKVAKEIYRHKHGKECWQCWVDQENLCLHDQNNSQSFERAKNEDVGYQGDKRMNTFFFFLGVREREI